MTTDLPLAGRRVALYVSGSVAACKACAVVTGLRKLGAEVRVAMTRAATRFVSPTTFRSLSGHPVATSLWDEARGDAAGAGAAGHGMSHIATAGWAELQLAVPASADLLARLAMGLADDAVTAAALATPAPMIVVPAMESEMWLHPATQTHVKTLEGRGVTVLGPVGGRLASGAEGPGRMVEPDEVVQAAVRALTEDAGDGGWLAGHRVLVTAGGTREPIDPVRYVGNRSSGKMGNALAAEALRLGAQVTLVTAADAPPLSPGLEVVEVSTAEEMLDAVVNALPGASVLVMAAAVADYRPVSVLPNKMKKHSGPLALHLEPTPDILRTVRDHEARAGVVVVGFAAETDDLLDNARRKLEEKDLDLIVANDVGAAGVGIGADDNAAVLIGPDGVVAEVPPSPKPQVARAVFEAIRPLLAG